MSNPGWGRMGHDNGPSDSHSFERIDYSKGRGPYGYYGNYTDEASLAEDAEYVEKKNRERRERSRR
jgi:hypothetical protein